MRVLQFAKRSVMTVAFLGVTMSGCGGDGTTPDAPFNPAGTSADMEAMNATFGSPTFNSFSTFSLLFDAALGGSPIVSHSAAALDLRGRSLSRAERGSIGGTREAAARSARRIAAMMSRPPAKGFSASAMTIPTAAAGKTFIYNETTGAYEVSDRPLLALNKVRFILYAVDPVTFAPVTPLVETGYVELTDLSGGTTQAAKVQVVSGSTVYIDYTVSSSATASSGLVTVIGSVTDGITQCNINLRSTINFTAGLTLTYSLDLPQRDVAIDLSVNVTDVSTPSSPVVISLVVRGPNGTLSLSGSYTDTTGTINVRINGDAFATITTNGTMTTITRTDGSPLADDELAAVTVVFEIQAGAFVAFDQMLAPVGAFFS